MSNKRLIEIAMQHKWWYSDQNIAKLLVDEIQRLNNLVEYAVNNIDAGGSNVNVIEHLKSEFERYY